MNDLDKFVYLIALVPFIIIWIFLFIRRKDLRKEMLVISVLIGIISVLTSYFWWTKDWWRPFNITGTVVGFEDFIIGFASGGIMSVIYNFLFNKSYGKEIKFKPPSALLLLMFMASLTFLFIFVVGLTSFWSCIITLVFTIIIIDYYRQDLILNSFVSGLSMLSISILFYLVVILISHTWVDKTYLSGLSGIRIFTIPIEEFIFWFLAGMWVGPLYEYALRKKLISKRVR